MIKKKYLVILFTLLLALFLGSLSTCYASLEIGQIQNFIYNKTVLDNYSKQDLDNWFTGSTVWNSFKTDILPYLTDNYDQLLIAQGYNIYVLWRAKESTAKINIRRVHTNVDPTTYDITSNGFKGFHFRYNDNTYYENNNYTSTYFNTVDFAYSTADWYMSNVLYFSGPFGLPDNDIIEGEYYTNIIFQFVPNGNSVTIDGTQDFGYRYLDGGWGVDFGSLTDSQWCEEITMRVAYYNSGLNKFGSFDANSTVLYNYNRNGPLYDYWKGTTTNDGNSYTTRIVLDSYKYQNCLIQLIFKPSNVGDLSTLYYHYYIGNNKTVISGGVIYPNLTFSGDYLNDYNNQEQTNNNQENNDNLINALTDSSYSGDITLPSIEIEDPTGDFFTWLYTSFVSVLNNNSNTYIDIPIWKTNYRIYSNVFMLPNGLLRDFISAGWWLIVGLPFLKFIRRTVETIKGGNVPNSDEKSDLLGNIM